jgi:hypothetical protein
LDLVFDRAAGQAQKKTSHLFFSFQASDPPGRDPM